MFMKSTTTTNAVISSDTIFLIIRKYFDAHKNL